MDDDDDVEDDDDVVFFRGGFSGIGRSMAFWNEFDGSMFCNCPLEPQAMVDIFFVHFNTFVEKELSFGSVISVAERPRLPLRLREPPPLVTEFPLSLILKPGAKRTTTKCLCVDCSNHRLH